MSDLEQRRSLARELLSQPLFKREDLLRRLPERIGRYEVRGLLGSGAQADVFLGHDAQMDREVAIKRMRSSVTSERIQREMQVLGRLRHPNIVLVHDAGVDEQGSPYYVMEYLGDRTLQGSELSSAEALEVMTQVARGCQAAHEAGVVHRDLKPSNIVLADRPVVVDFGIAKALDDAGLTKEGARIGTPVYMSPEQIGAQPVDARTDVYALGVVLYQLLCGELPYSHHEGPVALAVQITSGSRVPLRERNPAVPPALARVVERALETDPEDRYASAGELADAIQAAAGRGAQGPAPATLAGLAAGALLLLAISLWVASLGAPSSTPEPEPSPQPEAGASPTPTPTPTQLDLAAAAAHFSLDQGERPDLADLGAASDPRAALLRAAARSEAKAGGSALGPLAAAFPLLKAWIGEGAPRDRVDVEVLSAFTQRLTCGVAAEGDTLDDAELASACAARAERATSEGEEVTRANLIMLTMTLGSGRSRRSAGTIRSALTFLQEAAARRPQDRLLRLTLLHAGLTRAYALGVLGNAGLQARYLEEIEGDLARLEREGWAPRRAAALRAGVEELRR